MSALTTHQARLLALSSGIDEQIRVVNTRAAQVGCKPHELMTAHGDYLLAPLLVAQANVEVALLQIELAS